MPRSGLLFSASDCCGLARAVEVQRDEGADLGLALGDRTGADLDACAAVSSPLSRRRANRAREKHQALPSIWFTIRS